MDEDKPTEDASETLAETPAPLTQADTAPEPEQFQTLADPFVGFYQPAAAIRVGTWAGLPNYECSACQYASLDEAKTQAHLSIHGQTFTEGARP